MGKSFKHRSDDYENDDNDVQNNANDWRRNLRDKRKIKQADQESWMKPEDENTEGTRI